MNIPSMYTIALCSFGYTEEEARRKHEQAYVRFHWRLWLCVN